MARKPTRKTKSRTKKRLAPVPVAQDNITRVNEMVVARSRVKPAKATRSPWDLPKPPPRTMPEGMAMDDATADFRSWAAASMLASAIDEGLVFMGYAELSLLSQRPEYRRMVEVIARNMTRKFIKLRAKDGSKDKDEKIKRIKDALEKYKVQDTFCTLLEQDGFFGRAHLYIDTGKTDDLQELMTSIGDGWNKVSQTKIGKGDLKGLKVVEAVWCYPTDYNSINPLKPDWYNPTMWFVQGTRIHVTRLLRIVSREVSDLLKPAYSFGGLALTQIAKPYVDNWLRTRQSVADIIHSFSVFVLKCRLTAALNAVDGADLFKRAELFNNLRDNRGLMMIDKNDEEFENVAAPLSGLEMLQAQTQEHMSAVTGIPIVELLGIQPAGLNASSEGEIRTFHGMIHSLQERVMRPPLQTVLGFIQLSEFGELDPDIVFEFETLTELTDKELAEAENLKVQTDSLLIQDGVIEPLDARKRLAADEKSEYSGLSTDEADLPEPPQAELPEPGGEGEKDGAVPEPKPKAAGLPGVGKE